MNEMKNIYERDTDIHVDLRNMALHKSSQKFPLSMNY